MKLSDKPVGSILFVCTGNIFRSVVAEHATKLQQGPNNLCLVGSAAIEAKPPPGPPWIPHRPRPKGVDVSKHLQRKLTPGLMEATHNVVAMRRGNQEVTAAEV